MAKRIPKWQRALPARLRKHIRETTQRATRAEVLRNIESQSATGHDCTDCRHIAAILKAKGA